MELLYLLVEDCYRFGKHQEVSFSGEYNFTIKEYNPKTRSLILDISENSNHYPDLFQANILNFSGIIGENGTGKTSFFEFLRRLLSDNSYFEDKFLCVFKNSKNEIVIWNTLYDTIGDEEFPFRSSKQNIWDLNITHSNNISLIYQKDDIFEDSELIPNVNPKLNFNKSLTLYYSGIFDLKGYPYPETKDYIDVSTNVLISKDVDLESYSMRDIEFLYIFKHKNTHRQYKLIISDLLKKTYFPIPEFITISFEEVLTSNIKTSRDISPYDIDIFYYFHDKIGKELYPLAHDLIKQGSSLKNDLELNKGFKLKLKLRFADAILANFFLNIDSGSYYGNWSKVEITEIKKLDVFDGIVYYFSQQQIIETEAVVSLINEVYALIENADISAFKAMDDNAFKISMNSAKTLILYYEKYLDSFEFEKATYGFLGLDWRDMSSGEKAFLDLYSRIYYAKEIATKRFAYEDGKKIETVYLLLDEAEIGFHPEWQRKYIQGINEFLPFVFKDENIFTNTKVQVFIATHSPFVVSDLPKSNLIFLKKSADSIFNVQGFDKEKTFGANIHTLLSDAFFLQNGLIGEFSKLKILDCLNFLKFQEDKPESKSNIKPTGNWNQEKANAFIKIIGESLIAERLQRLYDDKYLTLTEIQKKIAELQEREKKLKQ